MQPNSSVQSPIKFERENLSPAQLLDLYVALLKPRLIEEKMLILLRQGKISKWFSGIGQEAISVGVTKALNPNEYILPMHRNLGVFTTRNVPLNRLFSQWQGKQNGFTKGRDRSFHFGTQEYKIVGMISHLGPQLGVADGIALAHKLKQENKLTAVFTGEGGTSEGDFHEALNIASVWDLPVIFCIENNGYGLSTPTNEQYRCKDLADRAKGYGMESHIIDGNNIIEVYAKVSEIAESIRENPRPVLLEFKTFRMRGHEEASGTKYVPEELMEFWEQKDPVENFRQFLKDENILSEDQEIHFKDEIKAEIDLNLKEANEETPTEFIKTKELNDVYQEFIYQEVNPDTNTENIRFIDAIAQAVKQSMQRHNSLVLMGQDIAEYGGVFKITEGLISEFGKERVRNTPICESAIVGTAMGLSISGMKAMVEMQFGDFVSSGFNPIVNYLAKSNYRWNQNADVVIRMPCGAGVGAGPFHSQTNEAWFTKVPGLKVVYPAFPYDAKGLLNTSFNDPNPILFFEHKALYRSIRQEVPVDYYTLPLGKASILKEGEKLTIITYGAGVHWALDTINEMELQNVDLIDLRSLQPLDKEAIINSAKKTGKVLILTEDSTFGSLASEISAIISEECFEYLDAPVMRLGSAETPIPFAAALEEGYLPKTKLKEKIQQLIDY
ncbi:alpha-ketoacid dehydrogenase subunit alpha/beta [Salegentibacter salarius]|uniref:Dehydrogenase n=1 Tax=Salegentibacter salarius TaxID=435906 RepID=A0A2N0TMQ8_9FLAO|nr:dehydrogenase E1 component subunit alpha/beta [Salegentibacter salarius]OEY71379.1 dehydrogenase [Salegentibacter salarius]PKD16017.1 dehydrogenase [Salegentibacter salarius]SLJ91946.1 2-oxoisovalerate dehydrogenase E1 component [Salegentibacter salarius]